MRACIAWRYALNIKEWLKAYSYLKQQGIADVEAGIPETGEFALWRGRSVEQLDAGSVGGS